MLVHVIGNASPHPTGNAAQGQGRRPCSAGKGFRPAGGPRYPVRRRTQHLPARHRKTAAQMDRETVLFKTVSAVRRTHPAHYPGPFAHPLARTAGHRRLVPEGSNGHFLVFTSYRILHIPTGSDFAYRQCIAQVRYRDIRSIRLGWQGLVMDYKNGRRECFGGIPRREKKKIRQLLPALPLVKQALQPVGRRHLCPRCTAVLSERTMRCRRCALPFKSRKIAALMAVLFPGGGYVYLRLIFPAIVLGLLEVLVLAAFVATEAHVVPGRSEPLSDIGRPGPDLGCHQDGRMAARRSFHQAVYSSQGPPGPLVAIRILNLTGCTAGMARGMGGAEKGGSPAAAEQPGNGLR